ncbi:MAG: hypothetical protein GX644_13315 [Limnobacter sp.]|nr:hypothetical protein [Limnobacter sp.]
MFGHDEIEKLRRLGLVERLPDGAEAVRLTVQCRRPVAGQSRERWRDALLDWQRDIGRRLADHGGCLVQDSLSVSGQTVEAIVPVDELPAVCNAMAGCDARVDLLMPRRAAED